MRYGKKRIRDSNLLPLEIPTKKKTKKPNLTTAIRNPKQQQEQEKSQRAGLRESIWGLRKFGK